MIYVIRLHPKAEKDLDSLAPEVARRILLKIYAIREDLAGDVKRLTSHDPEYRLRVGDWRGLFDVEGDLITVYRDVHRSKAYD